MQRIQLAASALGCGMAVALVTIAGCNSKSEVPSDTTHVVPKMKMTTDIPPEITTPDSVETRIGTLKFFDGFPDDKTTQLVYDNLDFMPGVRLTRTKIARWHQFGGNQ